MSPDRNENNRVSQAALSEEGCLAAYIAKGQPEHTYDFFVLHLRTKELIHRRYNVPQVEIFPDTILLGLRHTQRGWVVWTRTAWGEQFTFYRLARQMDVLWRLQNRVAMAANFNYLFASCEHQNRIDVWDLEKERRSTHAYNVRPNDHDLLAHDERLYMIEYGSFQHLISIVEFGENGCLLKPHFGLRLWYDQSIISRPRAFVGNRTIVFDSLRRHFYGDKRLVLHSIWMPGHMPNAIEMVTARILELTGTHEIKLGEETKVWTGGINQERIREIIRSRYWELVV